MQINDRDRSRFHKRAAFLSLNAGAEE